MPSGKTWVVRTGLVLALAVLMTGRAEAQFSIPGAGGGPAAGIAGLGGAAPVAATAAPVAAAAPRTLWSFLGLSKENLAGCRAKFCASPLGTMANNMVMPYSSMTGGLVPSLCPTVPTRRPGRRSRGDQGTELGRGGGSQDQAGRGRSQGPPRRGPVSLHGGLPLLARGRGGPDRLAAGRPQRVRPVRGRAGVAQRLLLHGEDDRGVEHRRQREREGRQAVGDLGARPRHGLRRAAGVPGQVPAKEAEASRTARADSAGTTGRGVAGRVQRAGPAPRARAPVPASWLTTTRPCHSAPPARLSPRRDETVARSGWPPPGRAHPADGRAERVSRASPGRRVPPVAARGDGHSPGTGRAASRSPAPTPPPLVPATLALLRHAPPSCLAMPYFRPRSRLQRCKRVNREGSRAFSTSFDGQ